MSLGLTHPREEILVAHLELDEVQVVLEVAFLVGQFLVSQISTELLQNFRRGLEIPVHGRMVGVVGTDEAEDHSPAGEQQLEFIDLLVFDLEIRSDAASPVYLAATSGFVDFSLLGILVSGVVVVDVGLVGVISLDEPSAGSVPLGGGEGNPRAVVQGIDRLNQALAKTDFAHQQSAIMVLYGAGHDFGSTGAAGVDEHHQGEQNSPGSSGGFVGLLGARRASVGNQDLLALLQELVRHLDGGLQVPSGVGSQVEDQTLQIRSQLFQALLNFPVGGLVKGVELDVADARAEEEGERNTVVGDLIANDGHIEQFRNSGPVYGDVDHRSLGAPQPFHHGLNIQPFGGTAFNLGDDVPGANAQAVGGRPGNGRDDGGLGIPHGDDDAQPIEIPPLVFPELGELLGVEEVRMGVQRLQHAPQGGVNALLDVDFIGVVLFGQVEHLGVDVDQEFTFAGLGGRLNRPPPKTSNQGGDNDYGRDRGPGTKSLHTHL